MRFSHIELEHAAESFRRMANGLRHFTAPADTAVLKQVEYILNELHHSAWALAQAGFQSPEARDILVNLTALVTPEGTNLATLPWPEPGTEPGSTPEQYPQQGQSADSGAPFPTLPSRPPAIIGGKPYWLVPERHPGDCLGCAFREDIVLCASAPFCDDAIYVTADLPADLPADTQGPTTPLRYVCGYWDHIFADGFAPTQCWMVFDRAESMVNNLWLRLNHKWVTATSAQLSDVEQSLLEANADALECPEAYGLHQQAELPVAPPEVPQ